MTRRFITLAAGAVALGVVTLLYRGPARELVRGHLGDIAAAMLVYAAVGLAARRWSIGMRAAIAFAFAAAIEFGQLAWDTRSTLAELTIGTSFDPWDLAAYALGTGIGIAWERALRSPA
jgi:hypothetical protein